MTDNTGTKIPHGYKQTEIGVIPDDWKVVKLGDIAEVIGGGTPSTSISKYWNGSINWFTPTEVGTSKYVYKSKRKITDEGLKNSSAKVLNSGTVLLTSRAGIGDLAILKTKASTNQGFQSLSPKNETNSEFLYYLMLIKKRELIEKASGSTFLEISPNNVRSILVQYPEIREQISISNVLSDTDALIEKLEKLIEKKKAIKQGVMQELLTGKRHLPGFSGEWQEKKLGDITHIKTGGKNNEDKSERGLYPFFVRSQTVERINSYSYDCEAILVPGEGGIGSIFHYINGKFDYHQRVYKISHFADDIDGKFVYYYMMQFFNKQAMQNSVKATVDSLRLPTFLEFELHIPVKKGEQTAIAEVLSNMDAEIRALQEKLEKYKQVKVGMMQQLLTGKIRLI